MKNCDCQCIDRPADFTPSSDTLRTLADDHRLCGMPAKFRWAMQWAAGEIDKLRQRLRLADAALQSDSPTLTDAEREAVERAIKTLDGWQQTGGYHSAIEDDAATLRGLLERTK